MVFPALAGGDGSVLAAVNDALAAGGVTITREDALTLAELRTERLIETERVEFGTPAVVTIAEAIADSPYLSRVNTADTLAHLQGAFYALRDELPVEVPDSEIVEALRGCLDELGDAAEVAALPADEVMGFSKAYRQALEWSNDGVYRIVDDEGRAYTFGRDVNSTEWDYDEAAPGWDGERWADDWND